MVIGYDREKRNGNRKMTKQEADGFFIGFWAGIIVMALGFYLMSIISIFSFLYILLFLIIISLFFS